MRVDFMVIGAQKCGTTSLAEQLAAHPGICFCRTKEPGYFHRVDGWEAAVDAYHALYSPTDGQICGEASTMYTFLPEWQGTHSRLYAYNPDLKLIYIMRHPVERVISSYSHDLVRGLVKAPPEIAVFQNPVYINRSRYGVQIRPYLGLFARENVLLLVAEEYASDQGETLRRIAEFLGVSADLFEGAEPAVRHKTVGEWFLKYRSVRDFTHSSVYQRIRPYVPASVRKPIRRHLSNRLEEKPHFSPALRQTLWRFLEDDVHTIEELLERRLDLWRSGDVE
jgi:hypothetical protein